MLLVHFYKQYGRSDEGEHLHSKVEKESNCDPEKEGPDDKICRDEGEALKGQENI